MHVSAEWIKIRERREDRSCCTLMQMGTVKLSQIGLATFLVSRKTIKRKNISFSLRIRPGESRSFHTRRNSIERAWTTSCMRKVGSSHLWLFHIFQLCAPIFPLPVGEFFSNFWWQLRSIRCIHIPIFKKFCRWEKNWKSSSQKVGFYFHLPNRIFFNLHILMIIPNNM